MMADAISPSSGRTTIAPAAWRIQRHKFLAPAAGFNDQKTTWTQAKDTISSSMQIDELHKQQPQLQADACS